MKKIYGIKIGYDGNRNTYYTSVTTASCSEVIIEAILAKEYIHKNKINYVTVVEMLDYLENKEE